MVFNWFLIAPRMAEVIVDKPSARAGAGSLLLSPLNIFIDFRISETETINSQSWPENLKTLYC